MLKIGDKIIDINKFPDGTLRLVGCVKEADIDEHKIVSWLYENDEEMVALLYIVNYLRDNGVKTIDLYMP